MDRSPMLRGAAVLAVLAALVVGCGSGAATGDADPAMLVPADAMAYAEVTVRPDGDVRQDALDAAAKLLHTSDADGGIRRTLDKALARDEHPLDYDKDIKPWLGKRIGLWFDTRLDREGDPGGSALIATTDPDAALDAFHKSAQGEKLTKRSYSGADYELGQDGVAIGIVDDFLVVGPEPEFKRVVDTRKGDALADADRYRSGVDQLDANRLAHFYVDLGRAFELARRSEPDNEQLTQLEALVPFGKIPPIVGSFSADGERLAVDVAVKGEAADALGSFGGGAGSPPLVQELPGDSWVAFGAAEYGQQLKATLDRYAGLFGGAAARQMLRQQYGIDLDQDILSWIGDVAVFARGDALPAVDGGVVIQVTDSDKAAKGFGKLVGLLQAAGGVRVDPVTIAGARNAFALTDNSRPKPIVLARSDERVVIVYGRDAAEAALSPKSKLGDSDLLARAKDLLGGVDPSVVLSMPAVLKLVDSSGSSDPDFERARPYLEAYDALGLGYSDGRVRFVAGLR
jgi:hypothetical protein